MKEIPLSQGKVALVDDEDYEALKGFSWFAVTNKRGHWYAVYATGTTQTRKQHRMHRIILGAPSDLTIDHIDGDGLNNQKCNLRIASFSQNCKNRRKLIMRTSTFKGVSWYKSLNKWLARIMVDRRRVHIGYFASEIEAARAYDAKAKDLHGAFARLNFEDAT